jgi:hypothetical protein
MVMLVVTVTQQRSGSKWLASILRKQFGLVVLGEVFNPEWRAPYAFRQFRLARGFERAFQDETVSALNEYFEGLRHLGVVQQLDVMFNQLEWPLMGWNPFACEFLYGYLKSRDAVILSLVRDSLEVFLSEKTLRICGIPHVFDDNDNPKSACQVAAERLEGRRVHVDPAEYVLFAESLGLRRRRLRETCSGYRFFAEISYESLADAMLIDTAIVDLIRNAAEHHGIPQRPDGSLVVIPAPVRIRPEYDQLFENLADLQQVRRDADGLPAKKRRGRPRG